MESMLSPQLAKIICLAVCLTLPGTCAASPNCHEEPNFPGPTNFVSFNRAAGREDPCLIPLRVADGNEVLFVVDTGSSYTLLDKSYENILGKRLGTGKLYCPGIARKRVTAEAYAAPPLYFNNTRLKTSKYLITVDLAPIFGLPKCNREGSSSSTSRCPQKRPGATGRFCPHFYCLSIGWDALIWQYEQVDRSRCGTLGRQPARARHTHFPGAPP